MVGGKGNDRMAVLGDGRAGVHRPMIHPGGNPPDTLEPAVDKEELQTRMHATVERHDQNIIPS